MQREIKRQKDLEELNRKNAQYGDEDVVKRLNDHEQERKRQVEEKRL